MSVRCFVVDDEPLARVNIEHELAAHDGFEVTGSEGNARTALEAILADPPDLLFLDVRMPGLDGMQLLALLHGRLAPATRPYVVLVTAFDRYALAAFEYEALDYLVKPFDPARFAATIARARYRIGQRERGAVRERAVHERLRLSVSGGEVLVDPDELRWVQAADHYLLLHTTRRSHLVRETMGHMERTLADHGFVRVHRGALVQPRFVERIETLSDGGRELHLADGSQVRVSRRRWPDVRAAFA